MGALKALAGKRLYRDANLFIYAVEAVEPWARTRHALFSALDRGECSAVTSELTVAECLVKPMELDRQDLVQTYLEVLQSRQALDVFPVDRAVLIEAACLRSVERVKLPDAIHVATALRRRCDTVLTNDPDFQTIPGLHTSLLADLD